MLSVQQNDVMALLSDFKCLRRGHVKAYLSSKYNTVGTQLDEILRQLRYMGKVTTFGEFVSLPGRTAATAVIQAFGVVICLTGGKLDSISPAAYPLVLSFQTELSVYGVVCVESGMERRVSSMLRGFTENITLVFVLCSLEQRKLVQLNRNGIFAIRDENKGFRFYKAAGKPRLEG